MNYPVDDNRLDEIRAEAQRWSCGEFIHEARPVVLELLAHIRAQSEELKRIRRLEAAVGELLANACSVPAPYCGNAMDPVNDLRLVNGRHVDALRALVARDTGER